jgi:hypothetical protein
LRFDQAERIVLPRVREQLCPLADDHGEGEQVDLNRAKLLCAAMSMGPAGLPAREANPYRDHKVPCGHCSWKTQCIADGENFG